MGSYKDDTLENANKIINNKEIRNDEKIIKLSVLLYDYSMPYYFFGLHEVINYLIKSYESEDEVLIIMAKNKLKEYNFLWDSMKNKRDVFEVMKNLIESLK